MSSKMFDPKHKTPRIIGCLIFCSLLGLVFSCGGIGFNNTFTNDCSIDDRARFSDIDPADFDDFVDLTKDLNTYSVVVMSDLHFSRCRKNEFMQKIQSIDFSEYGTPAMIIALGDIAENGSHEQYMEYNEFAEELKTFLHVPVFPIPGNHDVYDSALNGANYLQDVFPTTFYRIEHHDVSWYFLDSADGTFGYNQIHTLENLFSNDTNKKVICSHYPLYAETMFYRLSNYKEKAHLINLFAENNVISYLCGHTHVKYEHDFGSFREEICGSLVGDEEEPSFIILRFDGDGNYESFVMQL